MRSILLVVWLVAGMAWGGEAVIKDPNLEAAIRDTIGKPDGPLLEEDLLRLDYLEAPRSDITSLAGLEKAVNLQEADLSFNQLAEVTLPGTLTNLCLLRLRGNPLARLSVAAPLPDLARLEAPECLVTNLDFLSALPGLLYLDLRANDLAGFKPAVTLSNLEYLDLGMNRVRDLGFLSKLPLLQSLLLDDNGLTTPDFGSAPPSLTLLSLTINRVRDLAFLNSLPNLQTLDLAANLASAYLFPTGLSRLTWLNLGENRLTNVILAPDMTNLSALYLDDNRLGEVPALGQLTALGALDLAMNQLEEVTLPRTLTNLAQVDVSFNPLGTLVLPELLATNRLKDWVEGLRTQGVAVYTYPLLSTLGPYALVGSSLELELRGPPGAHALQYSLDLRCWQTLQWVTNRLGSLRIQTAAPPPLGFYRTWLP